MQIIFQSRDCDGAQMRDVSVQRVQFALRRMSSLVPRAKVLFSDVNGPRGGIDKRCQVELNTEANGKVVISSLASDWRTALDQSLQRATRALSRITQRNQKPVRRGVKTTSLALWSST